MNEDDIFKNINKNSLKEELIVLIKYLKKENFYVEALNIKVALEAISGTNCKGSNKINEFILFLSYSNKNTVKISQENNLDIVLSLIKKTTNF